MNSVSLRNYWFAFIFCGVMWTVDSHAQTTYFPPKTFSENRQLDQLVISSYSRQLAALKEAPLWHVSSNVRTYRFLWLRTFHHPIAVRLDIRPNGAGALTTKITDGAGGYAPGKLITDKTINLSKDDVDTVLDNIQRTKFWSLPTSEKSYGDDGAQWVIEAADGGRYHIVDRWTPTKGPIYDLGKMLAIDLAKINVPANEFY
ncbi:hypothetical protein [Granulicella paludicola]|uniref:hypothetical protein n=1 Tax=Granulicella paludicola TaxID=474951 RepID=UPI0021E0B3BD|nr:hypothetical protein [Granulicella paludicola]